MPKNQPSDKEQPGLPAVGDKVAAGNADNAAVVAGGEALSRQEEASALLVTSHGENANGTALKYLPGLDVNEFLSRPGQFEKIDTDGNQFITKGEVENALKKGNYSDSEKLTLRYMHRALEIIEEEDGGDEWGDENDGISRSDAAKHVPFKPELKRDLATDLFAKKDFHVWTETLADQLGLTDRSGAEMNNAFRHALTSAIYTFKFGGFGTFMLGELNEVQRKVQDYFTEEGDHWWKDSQADEYNNVVGILIAQELMKQPRPIGKPVTVEDVIGSTYRALQEGRLVVDVDNGANQFGKVLRKPE